MGSYIYQLSGGMRQRAMIAVALAASPHLLIADEPTTAIDVTIQAKVIDLLLDLRRKNSMSILFITHNLGLLGEVADEIIVMYLGKIVEYGVTARIYENSKHPYTQVLMSCIPREDFVPKSRLLTIEGSVPDPYSRPPGCPFSNRCPHAMEVCRESMPALTSVESEHHVACFLYSSEVEEASDDNT